jgi:hypothetical protein
VLRGRRGKLLLHTSISICVARDADRASWARSERLVYLLRVSRIA